MNKSDFIKGILWGAFFLVILNCANRGNPTGGEQDTEPPKIEKEEPENFSTNFNEKEIRIYFNEYVKIKDLQKQLIISPPMDPAPDVTPLGTAKKYVQIVINDTLDPNTTYAFNFGQSIIDNNEGNAFPFYKYVFSTGDYIDSLSIKGQIFSAENREPEDFISVMLYEVDSTYTDSVIYKERPRYITNTLDSLTSFSLENLKAGNYRLVAIKDANNNFTYEQKSDKIGFYDKTITVPTDSIYAIRLFKEKLDANIIKPRQEAGQKIAFGFEGDYDDIEIENLETLPNDYEYRITKDSKTDTLFYWYKPKLEIDTARFAVRNAAYRDTLIHRYRDLERDSLQFNPINSGTLDYGKDFKISANIPLVSIDTSKIKVIDKDSINIKFNTQFDSISNTYTFNFDKQESQSYKIELLPETFLDFFGNTNDSLLYNIRTKAYSDYSNVRVNLSNVNKPIIVQITDAKDVVKYELNANRNGPLDFRNIPAGTYYLRVIIDENNNAVWDSGNYLKGIQPEQIIYDFNPIDARANFDFVRDFPIPEPSPDRIEN